MPSRSAPMPDHRSRIADTFSLLRQGDTAAAKMQCDVLLAELPADAEVRYLATEVCIAEGDLPAALEHSAQAIAAAPGQWPLVLKRARVLLAMRRRDEFRRVAAEAAELAGRDPHALWEVGRAFIGCDDPEAARALFERALAAGGDDAGLHLNLATTQFFAGEFELAERSVEAVLARAPRMGEALYLRSTLRRQTAERNHVADLRARLAVPASSPQSRAALLYALAKELEDLGDYSSAFAWLREGAALKVGSLDYDAQSELDALNGVRATYTAEAMASIVEGEDGEGAIFIVGMPRTGTTLVERMLDRHPEVRSAGELMDFKQVLGAAALEAQRRQPGLTLVEASLTIDFGALGRDYMDGARQAARGSRVFIDKMPVNFIYCGLIHKALPKAKIIHLTRDPVDSCYAVFKTLFNQAYFFSYDLDQLADYFACYRQLMAHWHAVMPGVILDVRYEDVVADTEAQARRLLEWCGLEWQGEVLTPADNRRPSTTASAAQVREPVHARSIGRWRELEVELQPLVERLQTHGIIDARGAAI